MMEKIWQDIFEKKGGGGYDYIFEPKGIIMHI